MKRTLREPRKARGRQRNQLPRPGGRGSSSGRKGRQRTPVAPAHSPAGPLSGSRRNAELRPHPHLGNHARPLATRETRDRAGTRGSRAGGTRVAPFSTASRAREAGTLWNQTLPQAVWEAAHVRNASPLKAATRTPFPPGRVSRTLWSGHQNGHTIPPLRPDCIIMRLRTVSKG